MLPLHLPTHYTPCTCLKLHTAAQDSNPGSLSRKSEVLSLGDCAIQYGIIVTARMFAVADVCVKNNNIYIPDSIIKGWMIQCSYDNIGVEEATLDEHTSTADIC